MERSHRTREKTQNFKEKTDEPKYISEVLKCVTKHCEKVENHKQKHTAKYVMYKRLVFRIYK